MEKEDEVEIERKEVKGIKIHTLNCVMIIVAFVFYVFVILATFQMRTQYRELLSATEDYIACERFADQFSDASDYLCDKVRLYVINGNRAYADDYFEEIDRTMRRDQALDGIISLVDDENTEAEMTHAREKADRLIEREIYAMRLASEGRGAALDELDERIRAVELTKADAALSAEEKLLEAQKRVFGSVYQNEKQAINVYVEKFIDRQIGLIDEKKASCAEELTRTLNKQVVFISVLFIMNIVIFILIVHLIVRPLKIYMDCIRDGEMLKIIGAYEFKYLALTYNSIYEINCANEQMLKYKAEHDPLTGLVNREAFEQYIELCSHDANIALLIVDIDEFKQINDRYGHQTGDAVLRRVSKLLKVHFRATDCVARIGGDEFAVIVLDIPITAKENLERKINSISELLAYPEPNIPHVTLSVGAAFSESGYSEELYNRADTALYYVKEHGRHGYAFYNESMGRKTNSNT
ncbi:MAG: GGDEF domain-containing protein [Bacteroides sp.]|nr:GGDEF domain-containing protein [Eubacterium sp.]MCM1417234.1 GGDEF domain-containing protein [Roseburia sp.]MCM1461146.1 GGDEF domain-containing protein [Bacteroides sp.]